MNAKKHGEVLVLIPARGGSKSVPRKNILPLLGKPMIAWTIEHALACQNVSRVVVTTDDQEIAEIAKKYGAEVPFLRPSEISGDLATDVEFHIHALEWLAQHEEYAPDMVVNLRPTPPNRRPETIDRAIEIFAAHPEVDSLRSVQLANESPYKMWNLGDDGLLKQVSAVASVAEPYNQPRQKLPLVYWQNGYIDITRPEVILKKHSTTGDKIYPFIVDEPAADIDYVDQIGAVEAQLRARAEPAGAKAVDTRHPS